MVGWGGGGCDRGSEVDKKGILLYVRDFFFFDVGWGVDVVIWVDWVE